MVNLMVESPFQIPLAPSFSGSSSMARAVHLDTTAEGQPRAQGELPALIFAAWPQQV